MNKKLIFVVILTGLLVSNLVFASDNDNLIGAWINDRSELVMLSNGNGNWYNDTITWSIENNILHIIWRNALYSYEYSLSDLTLTMVGVSANDRGTRYVYAKTLEGIPENSAFAGAWHGNAPDLVLLNNGTGNWYGSSLTWRIENNYLQITWRGDLYTYNYYLTSSMLIMVGVTNSDRGRYVYTRR